MLSLLSLLLLVFFTSCLCTCNDTCTCTAHTRHTCGLRATPTGQSISSTSSSPAPIPTRLTVPLRDHWSAKQRASHDSLSFFFFFFSSSPPLSGPSHYPQIDVLCHDSDSLQVVLSGPRSCS